MNPNPSQIPKLLLLPSFLALMAGTLIVIVELAQKVLHNQNYSAQTLMWAIPTALLGLTLSTWCSWQYPKPKATPDARHYQIAITRTSRIAACGYLDQNFKTPNQMVLSFEKTSCPDFIQDIWDGAISVTTTVPKPLFPPRNPRDIPPQIGHLQHF